MALDAGNLTARIQLVRDVLTRESGVEVRTPEVYATVSADPEAGGGGESFKGQEVASESKWTFLIRPRTDVRAQHRVIYRGMVLEILSVTEDAKFHSQLKLECCTYAG